MIDRLPCRHHSSPRWWQTWSDESGGAPVNRRDVQPHPVDDHRRVELFFEKHYEGHGLIDADTIKHNIDFTRFPIPASTDHQCTTHRPGQLLKVYPTFDWGQVFPSIKTSIPYLELTQAGKDILANLYGTIFMVEHNLLEIL